MPGQNTAEVIRQFLMTKKDRIWSGKRKETQQLSWPTAWAARTSAMWNWLPWVAPCPGKALVLRRVVVTWPRSELVHHFLFSLVHKMQFFCYWRVFCSSKSCFLHILFCTFFGTGIPFFSWLAYGITDGTIWTDSLHIYLHFLCYEDLAKMFFFTFLLGIVHKFVRCFLTST
jgi:hypothetical protein